MIPLLLAVALLVPPLHVRTIPTSAVTGLTLLGETLTITTPGAVYTAPFDSVTMQEGTLSLNGSYTASSPNEYFSAWVDHNGIQHQVKTDCKQLTREACAEEHSHAVRAMLKHFPKDPPK